MDEGYKLFLKRINEDSETMKEVDPQVQKAKDCMKKVAKALGLTLPEVEEVLYPYMINNDIPYPDDTDSDDENYGSSESSSPKSSSDESSSDDDSSSSFGKIVDSSSSDEDESDDVSSSDDDESAMVDESYGEYIEQKHKVEWKKYKALVSKHGCKEYAEEESPDGKASHLLYYKDICNTNNPELIFRYAMYFFSQPLFAIYMKSINFDDDRAADALLKYKEEFYDAKTNSYIGEFVEKCKMSLPCMKKLHSKNLPVTYLEYILEEKYTKGVFEEKYKSEIKVGRIIKTYLYDENDKEIVFEIKTKDDIKKYISFIENKLKDPKFYIDNEWIYYGGIHKIDMLYDEPDYENMYKVIWNK